MNPARGSGHPRKVTAVLPEDGGRLREAHGSLEEVCVLQGGRQPGPGAPETGAERDTRAKSVGANPCWC